MHNWFILTILEYFVVISVMAWCMSCTSTLPILPSRASIPTMVNISGSNDRVRVSDGNNKQRKKEKLGLGLGLYRHN